MSTPVRARRLAEDEGRYLLRLVRRGVHDSVRYRRALIIMASSSGTRVPAIARFGLRHNLSDEVLGEVFGCSQATITRYHEILQPILRWVTRPEVDQRYSSVQQPVDCCVNRRRGRDRYCGGLACAGEALAAALVRGRQSEGKSVAGFASLIQHGVGGLVRNWRPA